MKAALNGVLNLSILDGWWDEWFDGKNGWAIPTADTASNDEERDDAEASALYDLIEHQLVPTFYEREGGIPLGWLGMVRHTMTDLGKKATSDRMVRTTSHASTCRPRSTTPRCAPTGSARREGARGLRHPRAGERGRKVHVDNVDSSGIPQQAQAGDRCEVRAGVALDGLSTDDVAVELAYGRTDEDDELARDHAVIGCCRGRRRRRHDDVHGRAAPHRDRHVRLHRAGGADASAARLARRAGPRHVRLVSPGR